MSEPTTVDDLGTCSQCGERAPVDSEGWCYPCFEDRMFDDDEEEE